MSLSVINLLQHIRDELEFLIKDSANYNYSSFISDKKTILSYTRSFEIIGEACKNVPDSFRVSHPTISWKGFAGLRDIIIHQYFGLDYSIIWGTILNEVPDTYTEVLRLIELLEKQ